MAYISFLIISGLLIKFKVQKDMRIQADCFGTSKYKQLRRCEIQNNHEINIVQENLLKVEAKDTGVMIGKLQG